MWFIFNFYYNSGNSDSSYKNEGTVWYPRNFRRVCSNLRLFIIKLQKWNLFWLQLSSWLKLLKFNEKDEPQPIMLLKSVELFALSSNIKDLLQLLQKHSSKDITLSYSTVIKLLTSSFYRQPLVLQISLRNRSFSYWMHLSC